MRNTRGAYATGRGSGRSSATRASGPAPVAQAPAIARAEPARKSFSAADIGLAEPGACRYNRPLRKRPLASRSAGQVGVGQSNRGSNGRHVGWSGRTAVQRMSPPVSHVPRFRSAWRVPSPARVGRAPCRALVASINVSRLLADRHGSTPERFLMGRELADVQRRVSSQSGSAFWGLGDG